MCKNNTRSSKHECAMEASISAQAMKHLCMHCCCPRIPLGTGGQLWCQGCCSPSKWPISATATGTLIFVQCAMPTLATMLDACDSAHAQVSDHPSIYQKYAPTSHSLTALRLLLIPSLLHVSSIQAADRPEQRTRCNARGKLHVVLVGKERTCRQ